MQVNVTLNIEGSKFDVGRLSDQGEGIAFQYDSNFLRSGLQISPFAMCIKLPKWNSFSLSQWRVSPAYDLVTSEAIGGEHMTTVLGAVRT